MAKLSTDAEKIMIERFGKDCIISLATTVDNIPYVHVLRISGLKICNWHKTCYCIH